MTLYYLVRQGTNVRITNKDGEPVIIQDRYLEDQRAKYERILDDHLTPLTIDAWHDQYLKPVLRARRDAKTSVREEALDEDTP